MISEPIRVVVGATLRKLSVAEGCVGKPEPLKQLFSLRC